MASDIPPRSLQNADSGNLQLSLRNLMSRIDSLEREVSRLRSKLAAVSAK